MSEPLGPEGVQELIELLAESVNLLSEIVRQEEEIQAKRELTQVILDVLQEESPEAYQRVMKLSGDQDSAA